MPRPQTKPPLPAPTLGELQRQALALAEQHGWTVEAEARDGSRLVLKRRAGFKTLVISLSPEAVEASADARRAWA